MFILIFVTTKPVIETVALVSFWFKAFITCEQIKNK